MRECFLVALLLLHGCSQEPKAKPKDAKVPAVAVARPKLQRLGQSRVYTGNVESLTQVAVVPQIAGQLQTVLVSVGDRVKVGQLLATVDDSQLEAQVQQAQAQAAAAQSGVQSALSNWGAARDQMRVLQQAVDQSKAQVIQSQAALSKAHTQAQLAQRNLQRIREVAAEDLIAKQVVDQTEAAHESALADVRSAEAQLNASQGQLEQARLRVSGAHEQERAARAQVDSAQSQARSLASALRLVEVRRAQTQVRSPIDGVVITRGLDPGAYVTPGGSTSVVLVASLEKLRVAFQLSEADLPLVVAGQKVGISLDALPGTEQVGKIQRLSGGLDTNTRTLRVEVSLLKPDARLRPGMLARLRLQGQARESLTIPVQGLITRGKEQFAFVVGDDQVAHRKKVTLRGLEGEMAILESGLKPDDRVVVRGLDLVQDGKPVKAVEMKD
jgi:HlyD family secretion protein